MKKYPVNKFKIHPFYKKKRASKNNFENPIFLPKILKMRDIVNILIVLLIVGWLFGYIGFGAVIGNLIHILLVVAVVMVLLRVVKRI